MKDYVLKDKSESPSREMVLAFDLGKGSIGEAVRQGTTFLHKTSLLIPAVAGEIKRGLRLAPAPVQELRYLASLLSLPTV